jgi:hypothetical protein
MSVTDIIAAISTLDPADCPALLAAIAARLSQGRGPAAAEPAAENPANDHNLTIEEAAALIRRSTKWIYRHRARLPFVRKLGPRSYICSQNALNRWLARRGQ